jgi:hypothetical protein
MEEGRDPLIGKFFLNFAEGDEVNVAVVAARVSGGTYLVEISVAGDGQWITIGRVVDVHEMENWLFFNTSRVLKKRV